MVQDSAAVGRLVEGHLAMVKLYLARTAAEKQLSKQFAP